MRRKRWCYWLLAICELDPVLEPFSVAIWWPECTTCSAISEGGCLYARMIKYNYLSARAKSGSIFKCYGSWKLVRRVSYFLVLTTIKLSNVQSQWIQCTYGTSSLICGFRTAWRTMLDVRQYMIFATISWNMTFAAIIRREIDKTHSVSIASI